VLIVQRREVAYCCFTSGDAVLNVVDSRRTKEEIKIFRKVEKKTIADKFFVLSKIPGWKIDRQGGSVEHKSDSSSTTKIDQNRNFTTTNLVTLKARAKHVLF
jgi:hypothetical protein